MNKVTVAVVPRDRFSKTGLAIKRVLEFTPKPYRLIVVDPGAPKRYRREMERAAKGHPDVEFLSSDEMLDSNACKNWVIRETSDSEYVAMVENDNEVSPDWLPLLIQACEEEEADVARPMILERMIVGTYPHFDPRLGRIEKTTGPDGDVFDIIRRTQKLSKDLYAKRQKTTVLEVHVVLFRRSVFDKIGFFDERVTTRQEVDLALQLSAADVPIVFEPKVQVTFHRPPPVYRDERDYFLRRWDYHSAIRSHEVIEQKWNLKTLPSSLSFARDRRQFVSYSRYMAYYARHELGPYLRWELGPNLRYAAYRTTNLLPKPLGEPLRKALYR